MNRNTTILVLAAALFSLPTVGFSTILVQESFEDTNYSNRGWYDTTGGALSSTEHISGSTKSLQCRFLSGGQKCSGGTPGRILFQQTEAVYVSYWIKHSANWTGSNKTYHPHEFMLLTNQNGQWDGLAWTRLTAYIEDNEGIPRLVIQDGQNVDKTRIGQNLVNITEQRAVAGCNGDSDGYGAGSCYPVGSNYWNGKLWTAGQVYFSDTSGSRYKGNWHRVEAFIKLNSIVNGKGIKDGALKYWYDGQLIIDRNDVVMRTGQHPSMKFNQLILAPWIGDGSPVDQSFWIDNLAIGTAVPGAGLSPPRNLRIQ
ncbi:MAG: hypothetical protein ACREX3_14905 [Gammaproteobacteria bacterium]